ncbi:MAG: hypothetical protein AABZ06_15250 [Bdellovibrionota bacterium]
MTTKSIYSRAPTRLDLAGGTLDIWPLYLFLKKPLTVNLAVNLYAETRLETTTSINTPAITLISEDQRASISFPTRTLEEADDNLSLPPALNLHLKLLRHFAANKNIKHLLSKSDLRITTNASSPAGAGLGGSSSLGISIAGALSVLTDEGIRMVNDHDEKLIAIVRDVESSVIQVPAGLQDYYAAMFGGLQLLEFMPGSVNRKSLPWATTNEIAKRLLLFYSGQSRNSGINNWVIFKQFIDNENNTRGNFTNIAKAASELASALKKPDWPATGAAIEHEWSTRKKLAPEITTKDIDNAFSVARRLAPMSGKICGAGGGGCFFLFLYGEDDESVIIKNKIAIQKTLKGIGICPIPFEPDKTGLEVRVTSE